MNYLMREISLSTIARLITGSDGQITLASPGLIWESEMEQLIFTGNEYEIVGGLSSGVATRPSWPVQDHSARWHYEEFSGQAVHFGRSDVHFGFMAEEVPQDDVPLDVDGEMNLNDLFLANNGSVYRAI